MEDAVHRHPQGQWALLVKTGGWYFTIRPILEHLITAPVAAASAR